MGDLYIELSIILLSVIAVLSVLIAYIVRQTLQVKQQYELQAQKRKDDKELWIDRHESESHILGLSDKLEKAEAQPADETNLEQMVTFTKRSNESVENQEELLANGGHNGHHHHHHFHHGHVHMPVRPASEPFYENTASDANEYSEYCVPNCEPAEQH